MAAAGKQLQPIIIKRVKKSGHAAHGGAWKIAYADFVTAMMAFFLLMWLLGSTTEGDKKGIADYFNSPLKVALMGGPGSGGSNSILTGGGKDLTEAVGQVKHGDSERRSTELGAQVARQEMLRQDVVRLENLQKKIENLINNTPSLKEFGNQIRLEKVTDGLHIQIVDEQNRPMFDSGSAVVKPYMQDILREIGIALNDVENRVVLAGHTDALPFGGGYAGYSNWELSADRANASRRELVNAGLPMDKLMRVQGLASTNPLDSQDPNSPVNRRISIIVLTKEAEEKLNATFQVPPPVAVMPELTLPRPAAPNAAPPAQ